MFQTHGDIYSDYSTGEVACLSGPIKSLKLANEYERAGIITQATDIYINILDRHPDTFEAEAASLALFLIAGRYEQEGKQDLAISLIRRLNTHT